VKVARRPPATSQSLCPYVVVKYVTAATAILIPSRADILSDHDKSLKEDTMRLYEFTDPSRYFPSKIDAAKAAEYAEPNPHQNVEDDAPHRQTKSPPPGKIKPQGI